MALRDRILEARKQKLSLTQAELAATLGVEAVTVSRWERGTVEPRPGVIRELARLAGVDVSWFFSENGDNAAHANAKPAPERLPAEAGTGFDTTGG